MCVEVGEGGWNKGGDVCVQSIIQHTWCWGQSFHETIQWKSCQIRKERESLVPRSYLLKLSDLLEYDFFSR